MSFNSSKVQLKRVYLYISLLYYWQTIPLKHNKMIESRKIDKIAVIKKKAVRVYRKNIIHWLSNTAL